MAGARRPQAPEGQARRRQNWISLSEASLHLRISMESGGEFVAAQPPLKYPQLAPSARRDRRDVGLWVPAQPVDATLYPRWER